MTEYVQLTPLECVTLTRQVRGRLPPVRSSRRPDPAPPTALVLPGYSSWPNLLFVAAMAVPAPSLCVIHKRQY